MSSDQREVATDAATRAAHNGANMSMKFGVMGSASKTQSEECAQKAWLLGVAIARQGGITVTGACPGLPLAAAEGAKSEGGLVVGISPGLSLDEHVFKYQSPTEHHDILIFTGSGLMGREVVNIRTSDVVAIVGGSSGTLGELAIAYDEGKLIGVLSGTGGITGVIPEILAACKKQTGARVIYDDDPDALVAELLRVYQTEHFRRPSCFCEGAPVRAKDEPVPGAERDPVCGMWIVPGRAVTTRQLDERTFYFCSSGCAACFDKSPHDYAARAATLNFNSTC
jgi:uncharacterized protein (TIGR00725 family)